MSGQHLTPTPVSNERLDELEALAKEHGYYELVTLSAGQFASLLACRGETLATAWVKPRYKVYANEILVAVSHYRKTTSDRMKMRLKGFESK